MNPKFRIKQIGDKYFPQKKVLFWRYIRVRKCMIGLDGIMYPDDERHRVFSNYMPDIKKFIDDYRNFYLHPFFVKNHLIKTYYDSRHKKFYYIDTNTKPYLYGAVAQGLERRSYKPCL